MAIFDCSGSDLARIAHVDKSAVFRWRHDGRPVQAQYQRLILAEAKRRGLPLAEVAWALGVPRCPQCGTYHVDNEQAVA
jgi:transposase-like protein